MIEQEPKEKLEEAITDWLYGAKITSSLVTIVLALIKGAGYVQLTDDQTLPSLRKDISPTMREEIKEIIKDWMLTGPLDDSPSDEDYDNVAKDIMEALNGE